MIVWHQKQRCLDWMAKWDGDKFAFDNYRNAIGYEKDGELLAVVSYAHYTGHDIEMGLLVEGSPPKGFVKAAFAYPFKQLGCLRVTAEIATKNDRMLRLIERFGFRKEGVKRSGLPDDDYILFGMTRAECRYL